MSRVLHAWFNQIHVGVLREAQGLWGFQYSTQWLETPHAFSLCPKLLLRSEAYLDGASQRPVQWYFDNLLPEENQRTLMAKDAQPKMYTQNLKLKTINGLI